MYDARKYTNVTAGATSIVRWNEIDDDNMRSSTNRYSTVGRRLTTDQSGYEYDFRSSKSKQPLKADDRTFMTNGWDTAASGHITLSSVANGVTTPSRTLGVDTVAENTNGFDASARHVSSEIEAVGFNSPNSFSRPVVTTTLEVNGKLPNDESSKTCHCSTELSPTKAGCEKVAKLSATQLRLNIVSAAAAAATDIGSRPTWSSTELTTSADAGVTGVVSPDSYTASTLSSSGSATPGGVGEESTLTFSGTPGVGKTSSAVNGVQSPFSSGSNGGGRFRLVSLADEYFPVTLGAEPADFNPAASYPSDSRSWRRAGSANSALSTLSRGTATLLRSTSLGSRSSSGSNENRPAHRQKRRRHHHHHHRHRQQPRRAAEADNEDGVSRPTVDHRVRLRPGSGQSSSSSRSASSSVNVIYQQAVAAAAASGVASAATSPNNPSDVLTLNGGSATLRSSTPYQPELTRLRMERLRIEEERMLHIKTLQQAEKARGPMNKWYELKTPQFHYEAHKNNLQIGTTTSTSASTTTTMTPDSATASNNVIISYGNGSRAADGLCVGPGSPTFNGFNGSSGLG